MKSELIRKKKVLRIIIIVCVAIAVVLIFSYTVFFHRFPIPYNQNRVSVSLTYGGSETVISFEGGRSAEVLLWDISGTLYIGYSGTLWTRFFNISEEHNVRITPHNIYINGSPMVLEENIIENAIPPIMSIYYMPHREIPRMDDETFERESADAILIWER